jgi:hypothetical protein
VLGRIERIGRLYGVSERDMRSFVMDIAEVLAAHSFPPEEVENYHGKATNSNA